MQLKYVREHVLTLILDFLEDFVYILKQCDVQSIFNSTIHLIDAESVSKNKEKAVMITQKLFFMM